MDPIPSSLVTAAALSAAGGKNPWLPLAMIFLLAAPESLPAFLMNPELHTHLHALLPVEVHWTLGSIFAVLAIAESLADKLPLVERWLVPISTTYRPFAGIAVATLVGVATARGVAPADEVALLRQALTQTASASVLAGGGIVAATIAVSLVTSWIATVGKTGARLLLTMVPVPGLKLAHSFLDDFFALGATIAGLMYADTFVVPVLLCLYVLVGLVTAPLLTRLAWIHAKIGWALIRKFRGEGSGDTSPARPAWFRSWLSERGASSAEVLPGYVYRAPELGWCRAGYLVFAPESVTFVTRIWWRVRWVEVKGPALARVGIAESATCRTVTWVERMTSGALREVHTYLYPARDEEVWPQLETSIARVGLTRVRSDTESARSALPGYADRGRSVRYLPPETAGDLRIQGLVTIAVAIGVGLLSAGAFVPIGAGYFFSPFRRRAFVGLALSAYITLCVLGSAGFGWPIAVLYAVVLNAVCLRDLTRNALKTRIDGFVDRRAWLPLPAARVWVPPVGVLSPVDRLAEGEQEEVADESWRVVVRLLAGERATEASAKPAVG